jgi:hypothetical protein
VKRYTRLAQSGLLGIKAAALADVERVGENGTEAREGCLTARAFGRRNHYLGCATAKLNSQSLNFDVGIYARKSTSRRFFHTFQGSAPRNIACWKLTECRQKDLHR